MFEVSTLTFEGISNFSSQYVAFVVGSSLNIIEKKSMNTHDDDEADAYHFFSCHDPRM